MAWTREAAVELVRNSPVWTHCEGGTNGHPGKVAYEKDTEVLDASWVSGLDN